jgi:hypothetical protein
VSGAIASGYKPSKEDLAREQKYRAESDVRTLHEAHQIRQDKPRHARAKAHAKAQMASMAAVAKA